MKADIGLIGLAVMGQNLVLNMSDRGFSVAVFNRTSSKTDAFLAGPARGTKVIGSQDLKTFFAQLKKPKKVMLMVKAGQPVDDFIAECLPFLEKGDVIIDGGNSYFMDTERRVKELNDRGILFIGAGISGGEEGARHGPSIMPGGNEAAWPLIQPIFQAIAAKASDGNHCCAWVGKGGSGHYVKMVHNGIEYGDMQLICEAYQLLRDLGGATYPQMQQIFEEWNRGELASYLIEITAKIFGYREKDNTVLLEKILDVAGQKGTGKWTGISALDLGVPVTLIGEAVFARCLSSLKEERIAAAARYSSRVKNISYQESLSVWSADVAAALYAAKIISYAQGFMLMKAQSDVMGWDLNYGGLALMWRGGCIIRSVFLDKIQEAFVADTKLANLLLAPFFQQAILKSEAGWRKVISSAVQQAIPLPCMSTALAFFDGYTSAQLPANLLQAQRDFFGAHTYKRIDFPRDQDFHTDWTGIGGKISSTSYNV